MKTNAVHNLELKKKIHKEWLYMQEDYDPSKPNDYETVINLRNKYKYKANMSEYK